jgi:uncharacterized membrane protein
MPKWLVYCIIAVVLWGVWGIIPKATAGLDPLVMQVISTAGLVPVALLVLLSKNLRAGKNLPRGMAYAFATGLCGGTGNVTLLEALNRGGDASVVFPLTGTFPLVTVVLAMLILKEKPNFVQLFGIGLAVVAIVLFSAEEGGAAAEGLLPAWRNMTSAWMAFSLLTLVLYGVAGVTQKLATNDVSTELATVCFAAAFVAIAVVILAARSIGGAVSGKEWFLAILFGSLIGVAMIVSFAAYSWGKASVVTAVIALYPAVTVVLAVVAFGEKLSVTKVTAIVLAIAAGAALGYERTPAGEVAAARATTPLGGHP